ncbi:MAG: radical SAM protein [Thermoguttaceae bacterium]
MIESWEVNFRLLFDHLMTFDLLSISHDYNPRPVQCFEPERIVLARGWNSTQIGKRLVPKIIALYPNAVVETQTDVSHPKVQISGATPFQQHTNGKKTLVFGEHKSAVRLSEENGNTCPNYWHFSPYGFCPYGCTYCYLAGTPGVKFSPSVKIFVNLEEILGGISKVMQRISSTQTPATNGSGISNLWCGSTTAIQRATLGFYHGKLQDGLALDPLTGYSRILVPFFSQQKFARQILLTKSADVLNLLELEHNRHTILSWTLSPEIIAQKFEPNTPPVSDRIAAMQKCAAAGYPVRAVIMPLIPVDNWLDIYAEFLSRLVQEVDLQRLTIGEICSYSGATQLMNKKLGMDNPINAQMTNRAEADGRMRYPEALRKSACQHLLAVARKFRPELEVGLCLETAGMFESLECQSALGKCNCVL